METINPPVSTANKLRKVIVSAHARLNFSLSESFDINRVYWYYAAKGETRSDAIALEKIYASPLPGKIYPEINLVYIVKQDDNINRILGEKWDQKLLLAGWGITRVGQKESLVIPRKVSLEKAKMHFKGEFETSYYFPARACEPLPAGLYLQENFVDISSIEIGDYAVSKKEPFIIPYSIENFEPISVRVKLSDEGVAFVSEKFVIITLRQWIGR